MAGRLESLPLPRQPSQALSPPVDLVLSDCISQQLQRVLRDVSTPSGLFDT